MHEAQREREREREGGRKENPEQAHTVSTEGLKLTNCEIMTGAQIKNWTLSQLSHPGAPLYFSVCVTMTWFEECSFL